MPGKNETRATTQTDMGPWRPAQGALTNILGQAQTLGGRTDLFRPQAGQQTQDAWGQVEALARGGPNAQQQALQPLVAGSAQGYQTGLGQLQSTASGASLDPASNPALMSVLNQSNDLVANRVNQQFSGAGRYGGNGANTTALATAIGANTNGIMLDQYNRERANQLGAANTLHSAGFQGAGMAGQLDTANLSNANLLQQVGAQRDAYETALRQSPLAALQWQSGIINPIGAMGQSGTTNQTQSQTQSNPWGTAIGGAMALGGLMSGNPMLAMNGMGSLIGSSPGTAANGGWSTNVFRA